MKFATALCIIFSIPAVVHADIASAIQSYEAGVKHRDDAATARQHFAVAAQQFDEAWNSGSCNSTLALARSRAHFLAGNLPAAIVAAHEGLKHLPHDRQLQELLEQLRDAVVVPRTSSSSENIRPVRANGLRQHLSGWDLFVIAVIATMLLTFSTVRRIVWRERWTLPAMLISTATIVVCTTLAWKWSHEVPAEMRVLRNDVTLRTGNGTSYPMQVPFELPRGTEVSPLASRGEWLQVQLAGGAIGWVPEVDTIAVR